MLNLHFNKNGKKHEKKNCDYRGVSNPGSMGSKSTEVTITLRRPMALFDKIN